MKAKKDGKLTTSPDPYGVDDISATKLGNMQEYIDTRQSMPGSGEYPNYHMNATPTSMPHGVGTMPHNYMMPPYEGIKM